MSDVGEDSAFQKIRIAAVAKHSDVMVALNKRKIAARESRSHLVGDDSGIRRNAYFSVVARCDRIAAAFGNVMRGAERNNKLTVAFNAAADRKNGEFAVYNAHFFKLTNRSLGCIDGDIVF